MDFVHLHVHSQYSLLDGANRIGDLVDTAAEYNMGAVAVTDHGNMFGAMDFYKTARKAGIKPILGLEAYISPTTREDKSMKGIDTAAYHLLLLAISPAGWHNLLKLTSRSFLEGFYYRPRIDREILAEHNEGLVCCTACMGGEVPQALMAGNRDKAVRIAGEYLDIFGKDRFYIELQNQGYDEQEALNPMLVDVAREVGAEIVGTNDVHFLKKEDKSTHEVLTCISMGKVLTQDEKMRYSADLYFKTGEEMHKALGEWPEALSNTVKIAEMCDCELDYTAKHLPAFKTPEGITPDEHLDRLSWEGLSERFKGEEIPQDYKTRLERELQVIKDKGYSSYMLIVNDCVQFARDRDIPAGPRGSGVATLFGYALRLTDVDPLRYGLLFERFTDPMRQEDPDIDLDICQEGRADVIQYVREKYGHVAQIITYGTLKARAAIRDVGRVMDIPLSDVDAIAKLVPEGPGVTLTDAIAREPKLHAMYESDPRVTEWLNHCLKIEGLVRHSGIHAAGVIVCDKPLDGLIPLCRQSDSPDAITQWDGPTCEKAGLMKMDFLGLRTLSIIARCRKLVKEKTGLDVDPEEVDLEDNAVFELFRRGETDGVFQFESEGMKGVLTQMQPNRIEDLIAANAMYRPGPMALIPTYCNRKNGKEPVPSVHPLMDEVLAETYGIMAYQEQVMQVINRLGRIPLNEALTGIKAISKKKEAILEALRTKFMAGTKENGVSERDAKKLFDLILEFASYGFNKAHSTRYAIVAYQTAYFKVHYPREFFAATLTYESVDRDKVTQYMAEAPRFGVEIAAPEINSCSSDFTVDGEQVRFGLAAVKGVGSKAVEAICEARGNVECFTDLMHFCREVDLRAVNRSTIEALIKCGAFDALGEGNRAAMLAALDGSIQAAQRYTKDRDSGQISLFSMEETETIDMMKLPDVRPWSTEQMLRVEKETLGFYVTSHPLARYSGIFSGLNWPRKFQMSKSGDLKDGMRLACGCMISGIRVTMAKRGRSAGKHMAILTLEDMSGKCEAVLFPETYEKYADRLSEDAIVYVLGKVSAKNERLSIAIDSISALEHALEYQSDCLVIKFPGTEVPAEMVGDVKEILGRHSGQCRVAFQLKGGENGQSSVFIEADPCWFVRPSSRLVKDLEALVGAENLWLRSKKPAPAPDASSRFRRKTPS